MTQMKVFVSCHCEERSDVAIQECQEKQEIGLLRSAAKDAQERLLAMTPERMCSEHPNGSDFNRVSSRRLLFASFADRMLCRWNEP
jgi:hypothetical protein